MALALQGWLAGSLASTPSPTACRAICPEGRPCLSRLVVSLSLCLSVCPWFDECCRRRLYMPAVSLLPLTSRAVVRPLCYALCYRQLVLLLQPDNSVSSIPHTFTCTLQQLYCTRPKPCALLPSTDQPLPWPARYTTTTTYNREAMFSDCAHGRPTVPC